MRRSLILFLAVFACVPDKFFKRGHVRLENSRGKGPRPTRGAGPGVQDRRPYT
jgi:hypothetical protein